MSRRVLQRIGLGLGLGLGLCLLAIALTGVWSAFSTAGARLALGVLLSSYNERIPGRLEVGEIDGRLADRLVLRRVVARDRLGQKLAEIDWLSVRWRPWSLWRGDVEIESLILGSGQVFEPKEGEPGFADLAFGASNDSVGPRGMQLPVRIRGQAQAAALHYWLTSSDELPVLSALAMDIELKDSRVIVPRLSAAWGGADFRVADASIDTETLIATAFVRAAHASEALAALLGKELPPGVELEADLSLAGHELRADVRGRDAFVELFAARLKGRIVPGLELTAEVTGELDSLMHWAGVGPGSLAIDARVGVSVRGADEWAVGGDLTCRDCSLYDVGAFALDLEGEIRADRSLTATARLATRLGPAKGRGLVTGECSGRLDDLLCAVTVDVEQLRWKQAHVQRAELAAQVAVEGSVTVDLQSARLVLDEKVYRLLRPARIVVSPHEVAVSRLGARLLGGRVEVNGRVGRDRRGALRLVAHGLDLAALRPWTPLRSLSGTLRKLELRVSGDLERPVARLSADVEALEIEKAIIGAGQVTASWAKDTLLVGLSLRHRSVSSLAAQAMLPVAWLASERKVEFQRERPMTAHLEARGVDLELARAVRDELRLVGTADVEVEMEGTLASPSGTLSLRSSIQELDGLLPQLTGGAHVEAELRLDASRVTGKVRAESSSLRYKEMAVGSLESEAFVEANETAVNLAWSPTSTGRATARLVLPLSVRLAQGLVPLTLDEPRTISLSFALDELDLSPWLDGRPGTQGLTCAVTASGQGTLRGEDLAFAARLRASVRHSRFGEARLSGEIDMSQQEQFARVFVHHGVGAALKVEAWSGAELFGLMRREVDPLLVPIELTAVLRHVDMALFAPFLPQALFDPRGALSGRVGMMGTAAAPILHGRISVSKGELSIVPLQARWRDIDAEAVLEDNEVRLERLSFRSGAGKASASGRLTLLDKRLETASLVLRLERFPFVRPGLPRGVIDSQVRAALDDRGTQRDLRIEISHTRIEVEGERERTPSALPSSKAVRFVDELPPPGDPATAAPVQERRPLALTVVIVTPAEIHGPGIDMSWGGGLSLHEQGGSRQVEGRVTATRGRFELLGNSFTLERGDISLPSGYVIDPYIDLMASTEADGTRIEVAVKGRLSRPDLSFTSDPPMTQPRIMALLVTGQADTGEQGLDSEQIRTKAASLLLAFNNPALEERFGGPLGIDRIKVGLGDEADEPIVGLGKWLSRKLYVESVYHHNAPSDENRAMARVEYHFRPRWSVETYYGDANVGGVDLFFTKRFQKSRAP